MSERVLYLDCVGGLAGDMLLAALVDAGAHIEVLERLPAALGLDGVRVSITRVHRQGIAATRVVVEGSNGSARGERYVDLRDRLDRAPLPGTVRTRSIEALTGLAEAEGAIHDVPVEEVRFDELGADTLVDLCGAFALLGALGVRRVVCSPLPFSRGLIDSHTGRLPLPAPATLRLLRGAPIAGVPEPGELVTPTGAAIVSVVADAWGDLPPMVLDDVGYGAGARELETRPNVVRAVLGTSTETPEHHEVLLLEANVDDMVPELVPDAAERCREAGAIDVWTSPAAMKKGRPGVVLSALARPDAEMRVATALLEHSTTLGVRVARLHRHELEREVREVEVFGHRVRVKVGLLGDRVVNVAPEHDDCAAVASQTGRPVKQVWAAALAAADAYR
ncbi:MAG TPA: nickel pincer cofactor biosynthesis protein LarC [Actinomycetota bacterium]|nr:nickel pincer cofactor biosynthesis protein LarC [Actinomycetota bacterium]